MIYNNTLSCLIRLIRWDFWRVFGWLSLWGVLSGLGAPGYASLWGFKTLSSLGFPFWLLPWLAFIPLLSWAGLQKRRGLAALGGFWVGCLYGGLYQVWFFDLHPLAWLGFGELESRLVTLLGWLLLSMEVGVLMATLFWLYRLLRFGWLRCLLVPPLWVLAFACLNATPVSLPWALLENTQMTFPAMRSLAHVLTGSGLCTVMVLSQAFWSSWAARGQSFAQQSKKRLLIAMVLAAFPPLLLVVWPMRGPTGVAWPGPIAVVQANLPIEEIRSGQLSLDTVERTYLRPVEKTPLPPGTLLLFPEEGIVPGWVSRQNPSSNPAWRRLERLAREKQLLIAVGVSLRDDVRHTRYNALAFIEPPLRQPLGLGRWRNLQRSQFYLKRRLVPFGEYTPYQLGEKLKALLAAWNIGYINDFNSGNSPKPVQVGSWRVGPLICFELIDALPLWQGFSWLYQAQGANALLTSANLGWFHQNPLLNAQFLAFAQLRAAETGLPLALTGNTGPSALLNNQGEIQQKTDEWLFFQHKTIILFYNGNYGRSYQEYW
jgi:apolipoprotein N-acyltransferase